MSGGSAANFVVDAQSLAGPRQDSVFDGLLDDVPDQPGVDGSIPSEKKSTVEVPITGTIDGKPAEPGTPVSAGVAGIPGTVLAAYQKVANDLAVAKPGCHLTWPLLAGIGKVESAHASGGRVDAAGNTRGQILGPVLDGGPGMAAIADTDGGQYDGNAQWDRAVGPMQFIPGTWNGFGADGNGDGVKNPHNVFDASRAAGDYLCSAGADLSNPQGLVEAVLRYNHSMDYVSTVLRWMKSYSTSTVPTPDDQRVVPPSGDDGNIQSDTHDDPDSGRTQPGDDPTVTPTTVPTLLPATTRPTQVPTPTRTTPTTQPTWSLTTPRPSTRPPWTQPPNPPVTKPPAPTLTPTTSSTPTPTETPTTEPPESPTPTPTPEPETSTPVSPDTLTTPEPTVTP
nr:lytic murein transglycosylase [Kribbella italica]